MKNKFKPFSLPRFNDFALNVSKHIPIYKLNLSNLLLIILLGFGLSVVSPVAATAKVQMTEPGSIVVVIKDELGNPLIGASSQIRLPNSDGKLFEETDITITKADGKSDGDLKILTKKTEDGDVETPAAECGKYIKDGQDFLVITRIPGYVEWENQYTYKSGSLNSIESINNYVVKIIVQDEDQNLIPGFKAKIDEELEIVEGSDVDADRIANGKLYFTGDVLGKLENKEIYMDVDSGEAYKKARKLLVISKKIQKQILFNIERSEIK